MQTVVLATQGLARKGALVLGSLENTSLQNMRFPSQNLHRKRHQHLFEYTHVYYLYFSICESQSTARYVYADGRAYKGNWIADSLDGEVYPQGAEARHGKAVNTSCSRNFDISCLPMKTLGRFSLPKSCHFCGLKAGWPSPWLWSLPRIPSALSTTLAGGVVSNWQTTWSQHHQCGGQESLQILLRRKLIESASPCRLLLSWRPSSPARESRPSRNSTGSGDSINLLVRHHLWQRSRSRRTELSLDATVHVKCNL